MAIPMLQLLSALVCFCLALFGIFRKHKLPLPPGPKGLPILGNIFQYPSSEEWVTFRDIGLKYKSDIISFNMLGRPIIVLNTEEATNELLVKRSLIYSDRANIPTVVEKLGFNWNLALFPYGDRLREHRKVFHKLLGGSQLAIQFPHIKHASRKLLQRLCRSESSPIDKIMQVYASHVILRMAYGIELLDESNTYHMTTIKGMSALELVFRPGIGLITSLPILCNLPSLAIGSSWNSWLKEMHKVVDAMRIAPLEFVKKSMADGTAMPSLAFRLLSELEEDPCSAEKQEEVIGNVLSMIHAAGFDSIAATLTTFVLAMVQNPAIMCKAQDEIDNIVGTDRLPEFEDQSSLPYTVAILKETLRWEPVAPLAIPHQSAQEDEYLGFHIPKGATVIGNSWAIMHNKVVYGQDTDIFNPERFLTADGQLNNTVPHPHVVFGYGRRICPGQNIAEATMWMALVSMLTVFNISKARNKHGEVIEPSGEFETGMTHRSKPFKCSIVPRSLLAETLIGSVDKDTP